jgi:hypothetical protein
MGSDDDTEDFDVGIGSTMPTVDAERQKDYEKGGAEAGLRPHRGRSSAQDALPNPDSEPAGVLGQLL